jgi:hypothetical protein
MVREKTISHIPASLWGQMYTPKSKLFSSRRLLSKYGQLSGFLSWKPLNQWVILMQRVSAITAYFFALSNVGINGLRANLTRSVAAKEQEVNP